MGKFEAPAIHTSKTKAKSYKDFFGRHDKGAPFPAFCKPRLVESMKEEARSMRKNIEQDLVKPEAKLRYRAECEKREQRVSEIEHDIEEARKMLNAEPDRWAKRREMLAQMVQEAMPRETDVKKGRVDPHRILDMEKGFNPRITPKDPETGAPLPLSEAKKEYQIISRLMEEESSVEYLRKD